MVTTQSDRTAGGIMSGGFLNAVDKVRARASRCAGWFIAVNTPAAKESAVKAEAIVSQMDLAKSMLAGKKPVQAAQEFERGYKWLKELDHDWDRG